MVKIDDILLITDFSENAKHALSYARAMVSASAPGFTCCT